MENLTLDDNPVQGGGVAARPGLVAASGAGGGSSVSGSSLGAMPATAARQRKPGRWKRFPRIIPTRPIPAADPIIFPKPLPPSGTTDFVPYLPSFRSFLPTPQPRESREMGEQPPSATLQLVVVRKGSKEDEEVREQSNREALERAKLLEEENEDGCDTEEAKVAFRAFKKKFVSFYRKLATTRPEDVVFNFKEPSDTP